MDSVTTVPCWKFITVYYGDTGQYAGRPCLSHVHMRPNSQVYTENICATFLSHSHKCKDTSMVASS